MAAQNPRRGARRAGKGADISEGLSLMLDGQLEPVAKAAAFPSHPSSFKPKRGAGRRGPGEGRKPNPGSPSLVHHLGSRQTVGWSVQWWPVRVKYQREEQELRHWAPSHEGRPDKGWFHKKTHSVCSPVSTTKLHIPAAQGKSLTLTGSQPCLSGGRRGELGGPQLTSTFHSLFHPLGCRGGPLWRQPQGRVPGVSMRQDLHPSFGRPSCHNYHKICVTSPH